jgi:catechol 2,3-dioxygenase-like lactoylglutathione lyase family enzyme
VAKLRHIAMVVDDIETAARFYETCLGMSRVRQSDMVIGLSDGVVSLVMIHSSKSTLDGDGRRGLHHLGFLVNDIDQVSATVEANGAVFHGGIERNLGERKYRDPTGQIFDLAGPRYARDTWQIGIE